MINNKLLKEIEEYCILNNITDIESKINSMLRTGFNIEKYGLTPFNLNSQPMIEEKEVETIEEQPKHIEVEEVKKKPSKRVRIIKN